MGAGMLLLLKAAEEQEKRRRRSSEEESKKLKRTDYNYEYDYDYDGYADPTPTIVDHIIEVILEKEPSLTSFFEMLKKEYCSDKEKLIREKTNEKEESQKEVEEILSKIEQEYLPKLKAVLREKGIEAKDVRIIYHRPWFSSNSGFSIEIDGESLYFDKDQAIDCFETIRTILLPKAKEPIDNPEKTFLGRKIIGLSRQIAEVDEEIEKISLERKGLIEQITDLKNVQEKELAEYKQRELEVSSIPIIEKVKGLIGLLSPEKREEKKEKDSIKAELRQKMDERYRKIVELKKEVKIRDEQKEKQIQKKTPLEESLLELRKQEETIKLEARRRVELLDKLLTLDTPHRDEFKDTVKSLGYCLSQRDKQSELYYEIEHLKDEYHHFHEDILEKTYERLIAEGKVSEESLVGVFEKLKEIEKERQLRGYETTYMHDVTITKRIVEWFVEKVYRKTPDYVETMQSLLEEKITEDSESTKSTSKKYKKR